MKRMFILPLLIIAAFAISACGHDAHSEHMSMDSSGAEMLKVNILTASDAFNAGTQGKIEIKVTQGKKNVTDATEVKFQVWKDDQKDQSKMLKGKGGKGGVYSANYTFPESGSYHVIAHVTANGSHTMPEKTFTVQ
ncbi:FixH family protein [Camelliibacillus cellulosilyticus]|uniref:FixH family protein n=1 Tax=Camelliibacillus cellulosilyticus TaxID=2174486 RepID=A0ABV9GPC4_9BACL